MASSKLVRVAACILCLLFLTLRSSFSESPIDHSLVVGENATLQVLNGVARFADTVRVKIAINSSHRERPFEVCFHRNTSRGIGMCPHNQWEKVSERRSWSGSMSPYEHKVVDIRIAASSSLDIFEWSGTAIGVVLVILIVLFQGIRLLPTGRKYWLGIFLYSSAVGLGSFLLSYIPGLIRSVLTELGISQEMYILLVIFVVAFIFLAGAWLGFWTVRKMVLKEDGSIDSSTSLLVPSIVSKVASFSPFYSEQSCHSTLFYSIWNNSLLYSKDSCYDILFSTGNLEMDSSPSHVLQVHHHQKGYSLLISTRPERGAVSRHEWESSTKQTTEKALEELASSRDFGKWVVANADRISITPLSSRKTDEQRRRWWKQLIRQGSIMDNILNDMECI
ncbi:hypothetical protein ACLB2K_073231 [Fragaria x ananassa]